MGLFSFLSAPKKMEEIKMALVGKYVYDNQITDNQKRKSFDLANDILIEGISDSRTLNDLPLRVQYVFLALAMAGLGIDHGLRGFQWTFVKNPFMVQTYDEDLWMATMSMLKDKYGLDVIL